MVKTMRDIVRKLRRCAVYALLITFCLACAAAPAGAENFKTGEYLRSTGLEALQAADAYALGFTGKGVTVGVIDTRFAPAVDEFAGKYPYGVFSYAYDKDDHGIHVAGIIAAAKDNMGMHGAAFDSTLLPSGPLGYSAQALQKMLEYPDVRIISNSWGANLFLDQSEDFDTLGIVTTGTVATPEYISNYHYPYTPPDNVLKDWTESTEDGPPLLKLAEADKLLVFAAGNAGHLSPGVNGALPSLAAEYAADADDAAAARNLRLHWLNVSAFDPAAYDPTAPPTRLGPDFVAAFTDMGLFASDYTLWAPGVDIDSTIAADAYKLYSGTSMAAPYVAGVAALAQSAFP
ncbi:MAG: S8 family serine peptidase, partial [Desulfovibrio sp.]|nr:S8 family serine peptidase [Desulfovibrio sp.]